VKKYSTLTSIEKKRVKEIEKKNFFFLYEGGRVPLYEFMVSAEDLMWQEFGRVQFDDTKDLEFIENIEVSSQAYGTDKKEKYGIFIIRCIYCLYPYVRFYREKGNKAIADICFSGCLRLFTKRFGPSDNLKKELSLFFEKKVDYEPTLKFYLVWSLIMLKDLNENYIWPELEGNERLRNYMMAKVEAERIHTEFLHMPGLYGSFLDRVVKEEKLLMEYSVSIQHGTHCFRWEKGEMDEKGDYVEPGNGVLPCFGRCKYTELHDFEKRCYCERAAQLRKRKRKSNFEKKIREKWLLKKKYLDLDGK